MTPRYANILKPIQVGGLVLKNRLIDSKCVANYLQGPQNYPSETTVRYTADLARNGASVVTCTIGMMPDVQGIRHSSLIDMSDKAVRREYRRMLDRIHAYGSLAAAPSMSFLSGDWNISRIRNPALLKDVRQETGPFTPRQDAPEMTGGQIREMIDQFVSSCRLLQAIGFDMVTLYMCYGNSVLAKSLSPLFNQREDDYGGCGLDTHSPQSVENRARLTRELLQAVKAACGESFLVQLQVSGREDHAGGYTAEDFVEYCRCWDGLADIVQVRAWSMELAHVNSYTSPKAEPLTLPFARALKQAGLQKTLVAPVGGFQDLDLIDRFLGEGSCDLVSMARAFLCDDGYGEKLLEGRGEDVVPCIRCDCCHQAYCAVNPKIGIASYWDDMFAPPASVKNVAVIGGGPAGMKAAMTAAQRGHRVTLYEASAALGGQLRHADYLPEEKWALLDFKNYLVRQVTQNARIQVRLNTRASRADIQAGGFDAVIAACGSAPKPGSFPGADRPGVWAPIDVFGREAELGHSVVIVGGGMAAVDTALYLLHHGHLVTLVTRQDRPGYDSTSHGAGAYSRQLMGMQAQGLTVVPNAQTLELTDHEVLCAVAVGGSSPGGPGGPSGPGGPGRPGEQTQRKPREQRWFPFDSVVVSAGRQALTSACMEFAGLTAQFFVAGDASIVSQKDYSDRMENVPVCDGTAHGTVRGCMFTAWTAANNL